jgi:hypothetical protein
MLLEMFASSCPAGSNVLYCDKNLVVTGKYIFENEQILMEHATYTEVSFYYKTSPLGDNFIPVKVRPY